MQKASQPDDSAFRLPALIAVVLVVITLVTYSSTRDYGFVDYDDPDYVSDNPVVQRGLSAEAIGWALSSGYASNWHPLTWLSLMLDCQVFGVRPGPMHLHNVGLHAASAVLLFWILRRLTGSTWRSAFAAALFAWHPLRVESVAWIAERKDVLSTLYWLITLWAWLRFLEQRTAWRYALALLAFTLGLMSKPMLVGLPCVLVILDFWPLQRWPRTATSDFLPTGTARKASIVAGSAAVGVPWRVLVLEKAPFIALAFAACVVTVYVQRRGGAMTFGGSLSLAQRATNGVVAYAEYLRKFVWPHDLAVFYPHPGWWPMWRIAAAAALLALVTVLAVRQRNGQPYLLAGWLWYLVTLLPVLGLVHVGSQAWADRYTYVPMIGIAILAAWGSADLAERGRWPAGVKTALAAVVLVGCIATTALQVRHWQSTLTLFNHALEVTQNNQRAHKEVADVYDAQKQFALANQHYEAALQIDPKFFHAQMSYGISLYRQGRYQQAAPHFLAAIQINGNSPEAHTNLGVVLAANGQLDEAIFHYREALRLRPGDVVAQRNLTRALAATASGRTSPAVTSPPPS